MAEELSEVNELYGRGFDGKMWVLNGRLVKKEIKKEEEEKVHKYVGDDIDEGEMVSGVNTGSGKETDAKAVPNYPSQPSSVIHPQIEQPQLSVKAEEGQATINGGESIAEELQQLRAMAVANERALKDKQLLNEMLMAKLEEVRKEKKTMKEQLKAKIGRVREENSHQFEETKRQLIEEQQKIEQLTAELELEKEKSNNMNMVMDHSVVDKETSTAVTTLQPSRAVIAAQLLGVDIQLLGEPQPNEWKEKFNQLNIKYGKVKRLYRTEQKVAAKLRQKLEDKKKDATPTEELTATPQHDAGQNGSSGAASSLPLHNELLLSARLRQRLSSEQQMDVQLPPMEEEEEEQAAPTTGVFKCPQCPANRVAFSSAAALARHHQHFHGDRQHYQHQCQECGLACASNGNLERHRRTHTGERPHKCGECGRAFAKKCNLTKHERVHSGERPYSCAVCQKAFIESSSLVKHARVHSGEKPFSCRHCARPFKDTSTCRRHEQTCPIRAHLPPAND